MPTNIVVANLTPETRMGNESPRVATRPDLRDGSRGDSGGGGVVIGDAPAITAISGTFGQGNSLTLSGSFSAKRNGQIAYIAGDPAKLGQIDEKIVGFSGESTGTGYTHDNTRSFGKSGVSLLADFAGNSGVGRHTIRLPQRSKALFLSAEIYADLSSWDVSEAGPQIKFMRLLSQDGLHYGFPEVHHQLASFDNRLNPAFRLDGYGGNNAGTFPDLVNGGSWARNSERDEMDRKWNRHILFARLPDPIDGSNGQRFARIIDHLANRQIPTNRDYTDPSLETDVFSFFCPATLPYTDSYGGVAALERFDFLHATLPFYQLSIPNLKVWADCIYVNDTPERVELGNAPTMDACTKLVVQRQVTRTSTGIEIQVEEGNLQASDPVYVFAVNDDTQYTQGFLIREAV